MNYPAMTRNFRGTATSVSNVKFKLQEPGFYTSQEYEALYVADTPVQVFDVQLGGGAATVVIEGNEWNPDTSADWYSISTSTGDFQVQLEEQHKFVRARVSAYTSGTVTVNFTSLG